MVLCFVFVFHTFWQGDPEGQYELGKRYDEGFGIESDVRAAIGWYEKAARQGHAKVRDVHHSIAL